jgi:hypothetical protein
MSDALRRGPRVVHSPVSKDEMAEQMARNYYEIDDRLTHIIRILDPEREDDPGEPIKLLEVFSDAVPSGVILPVGFPAHPETGRYFRSQVVLIAPSELEKVRSGHLPLPQGWVLGQEYAPPAEQEDAR